jgi:hypothetical protein
LHWRSLRCSAYGANAMTVNIFVRLLNQSIKQTQINDGIVKAKILITRPIILKKHCKGKGGKEDESMETMIYKDFPFNLYLKTLVVYVQPF